MDLIDFQGLQLCFGSTETACVATYDRAMECGVVDVEDLKVFLDQLGGPEGTAMMAMAGGAGEPMSLGGAVQPAALTSTPPDIGEILTGTLTFELRPLGASAAVAVLVPHTAYEVHYSSSTKGVSWYLLNVLAASAPEGVDSIEPPAAGPWAGGAQFYFEDTLSQYGELQPARETTGRYRTDWAMETGLLANDPAPATGHLCTIITGQSGQLVLDLTMLLTDETNSTVTMMNAFPTYDVRNATSAEE
ncbi:MAG: hypothetical protein H6816_12785 [Phycisphaerales bacterium]|nr:hypothetical protein [Phycisphaerales bacterium]